ncbi:hypothetical protein [Cohnella panacarvi]|uniref:hypothetical protein n=1 Tax=Cohnella panacarvi TaxID=400776 RepID=UPI00047A56C9|nr:hypothetical protein [Cohnella panacarvi]
MVDSKTQIEILLAGDPLRFACNKLGVKDMTQNSYKEVFTVSKEEIFQYVLANGIPQNYSNSRHSVVDGFHFFEDEGKWYTCFRERGFIFDDHEFIDYEEGAKYIVEILLKMTGTGLY